MSPDEAPLSTHPASQAWFALWLANDPNTALIASLRPSQKDTFWAALRRPFERPHRAALASELREPIPGLRARTGRWLGVSVLLGLAVGLCSVWLELRWAPGQPPAASGALPGEPRAATTLSVRPAPPPALLEPIASGVAPPTSEGRKEPAAVLPRAATAAVPAAASAKKKPVARRLRRDFDRTHKGRRAPR